MVPISNDLNKGHYLIDDRKKNGAGDFEGELILFGSVRFRDWMELINEEEVTLGFMDADKFVLVRICNPRPAENGFEIHTHQTKTIFTSLFFMPAYKSVINEKKQITNLQPAGCGLQIRTSKAVFG